MRLERNSHPYLHALAPSHAAKSERETLMDRELVRSYGSLFPFIFSLFISTFDCFWRGVLSTLR